MTVKKTAEKKPVEAKKPAAKPVNEDKAAIELTKNEFFSLRNYIQDNLLGQIRESEEWDNFVFTKRIFDIWEKVEAIIGAMRWKDEPDEAG